MRPEQEHVTNLLKDTVTTLCRNSLQYLHGMKVQGLLGITLDDEDVFVVHINEIFHNLGTDGVRIQQADSVSHGEEIDNYCEFTCSDKLPPEIAMHPAVPMLSSTSPLGKNRRKTRPIRAIGGLSSPVASKGPEAEVDLTYMKNSPQSDQESKENEPMSQSLTAECDDDDADVCLMKQSYMTHSSKDSLSEPNNNSQTIGKMGIANYSTACNSTSSEGSVGTEVILPKLEPCTPQFSVGGPFIAGIAQGFSESLSEAAEQGFQLQEVNGSTLIMGVPASSISAEGLSDDWPMNNEEMGLTSRGLPRKRRMWYRPRSAASTSNVHGEMGRIHKTSNNKVASTIKSQDNESVPAVIVIKPTGTSPHRRRNSSPPSSREFKCEICDKSYWSRNTLMRHQKSHDPKLVSCRKCTLYFESEDALRNHESAKHINAICGRYKCRYCEKIFRRKHQYLIHLRMVHNTISNG